MSGNKLQRCPFCRGESFGIEPGLRSHGTEYCVFCDICYARGPYGVTALQARIFWNQAIPPKRKRDGYEIGDKVKVRVWSDYCKRYEYYEGVVDSLNYFEKEETTVGIACHPVGYPDQPTHYFYNDKLRDGIAITKDIIELEKK